MNLQAELVTSKLDLPIGKRYKTEFTQKKFKTVSIAFSKKSAYTKKV